MDDLVDAYRHDETEYPPFGKHSKTGNNPSPWSRVPLHYLRWMIQVGHHLSYVARAELDRRKLPYRESFVEVTGHAVDKASLTLWRMWQEGREETEGLHGWLGRISEEAYYAYTESLPPDEELPQEAKVRYQTGVLVFNLQMAEPVLVTCYPAKNGKMYDGETDG